MWTLFSLLVPFTASQVPLRPEALQEVFQTSEWTYYSVPLRELEMKHWTVSLVAFSSVGPIALTLRRGAAAVIGPEGVQTDAMDWPGWTYNQTKQVLFFRPFALEGESEGVVGVYCPLLYAHYSLQLSASLSQLCPSNCSNHGFCRYTTCLCEPGYTGQDCRLSTSLLGPSSLLSLRLPSGNWSLAAVPLPRQTYDGAAVLTLTQINAISALLLCVKAGTGDESTFPTYFNSPYMRISSESPISTTIPYGKDPMMYIAVYNAGPENVEIRLAVSLAKEFPSDSDQSLTISLSVALSGGFTGLVIGVAIYIIHRRKASIGQKTTRSGISRSTIDTLYPLQSLTDLKSRNFPTQCDSCDDFFLSDSQVRVLPCSHVFHSKCIDPWLARHTVIPT